MAASYDVHCGELLEIEARASIAHAGGAKPAIKTIEISNDKMAVDAPPAMRAATRSQRLFASGSLLRLNN